MDYTPEQQADFQERAKAFETKFTSLYEDLKKEFECELKYMPVFVPSPSGVFGISLTQQISDIKYAAKPTPFVPTTDGGVEEAQ